MTAPRLAPGCYHRRVKTLALALVVLAACAPQPAATHAPGPEHTVVAPPSVEPSPASPTPASATSSPPVASATADDGVDAAAGASHSCLMRRICECNLGCAAIAVRPKDLAVGLRSVITWGSGMGESGVVVKTAAADGSEVFILSNVGPGDPSICSISGGRGNLLGFGCERRNTGPVDPHACDDACRD